MTATLILLRHGESEWNAKNLFTGWVDVDINEKGIAEGKAAAGLLKAEGLLPDILHTSLLRRAIHTAYLALDGCDRQDPCCHARLEAPLAAPVEIGVKRADSPRVV